MRQWRVVQRCHNSFAGIDDTRLMEFEFFRFHIKQMQFTVHRTKVAGIIDDHMRIVYSIGLLVCLWNKAQMSIWYFRYGTFLSNLLDCK